MISIVLSIVLRTFLLTRFWPIFYFVDAVLVLHRHRNWIVRNYPKYPFNIKKSRKSERKISKKQRKCLISNGASHICIARQNSLQIFLVLEFSSILETNSDVVRKNFRPKLCLYRDFDLSSQIFQFYKRTTNKTLSTSVIW
jgi:hypothetical protein